MTPYSAAAGGSLSSRASSRVAALRTSSGRLDRLEPLAQLVDLGLLARRPRRAPPGSPSAAGGGRTRAGPSRSRTATCDWIFVPSSNTSSSRLRISETARSRSSTFDQLEQLLLLLGLQAQRRGDEVAERARVVDVRGRELQLLGQVRDEPDDAREQGLDVARQRLDLARLRERRPAAPRTRPTRYGSVCRRLDEPDAVERPGRGSAASRRGP